MKNLCQRLRLYMEEKALVLTVMARRMGDGELASSFDPKPRNFTIPVWQKVRTDGEIFWIITNGTESGMPPFGDMLSDEEKWGLVNYIRELGKTGGVANKSN